MQRYLEEAYCAYEGAYQIPIYGMFDSDRLPASQLRLPDYDVSKSSKPFHLEYPDKIPRYEVYVFDIELSEFPHCWHRLADSIFEELQRSGSKFSWLSLDPGFDFGMLFGDYFAQHVYAFCQSGERPVYVENEGELSSSRWATVIRNLEVKWRLVASA